MESDTWNRKRLWNTGIAVLVAGTLAVVLSTTAAAQEEEPCDGPQDLEGHTLGDGIILNWTAYAGADSYNIYRAEGGGELALLESIDGDFVGYFDGDVEAGTTYTYALTAVVEDEETEACGTIEVTAVPVLPTLFAGAMAVMATVGVYAFSRRRT